MLSVEAILKRCTVMLNSAGQPIDCVETLRNVYRERCHGTAGLTVLALAKKPVADNQNSVDHPDIETGLIFLGLQGD